MPRLVKQKMLKNIKFEATYDVQNVKLGIDLQMPKELGFKFNVSGECDTEFLKRLTRLIKAASKPVTKPNE